MKIQHVSLIPTVCSGISIFFFIFLFSVSFFFLLSFQRKWEEETGNNNFSEIARLFPQKGNPIYAVGRGKEGKHIRGLPRCALIFKVASEICRFWRINTEGRRERALEDPVPS